MRSRSMKSRRLGFESWACTMNPLFIEELGVGEQWNGDHENGNHISRLRYNTFYLPKILRRIEEAAPEGADLRSWQY